MTLDICMCVFVRVCLCIEESKETKLKKSVAVGVLCSAAPLT